jgi:uncharacterized cupin superfamily protein
MTEGSDVGADQRDRSARVSLDDALAPLPLPATSKWPEGVWDRELLRHGSLSLSIFAPRVADHQTPHPEDEVYVVARGHGTFEADGVRSEFGPGDALFVAAGVPHRFTSFSDDLVLWVVFCAARQETE